MTDELKITRVYWGENIQMARIEDAIIFGNRASLQKILDRMTGRACTAERTGKWIEYPDCLKYEGAYSDDHIVCSNCHHVFNILDNCTEEFDFCPHCGSDMRDMEETND